MRNTEAELLELKQENKTLRGLLKMREEQVINLTKEVLDVRAYSISYVTLYEYMKDEKMMAEIKKTLADRFNREG